MNIEEAIKILEELKKNECGELLNCWDYGAEESKAIETLLTAYEKEKEKNKELESDIQQKNFEIKCLNSDIKNMYCEEGVIAILEDNFDLSREEAIQILEEE